MFLKLVSLLALIFGANCNDDFPVVNTPLGQVRGYYQNSYGGQKFATFEGIPFAKPPIGERRFEEAEPIEPWSGIWNASYPTECAQNFRMPPFNKTVGDEDCLHMNVYVPSKSLKSGANVKVIVHVHGGAYVCGSGHGYMRPDFILDYNVIFVTFNYRLGILGFLSTEDDIVPGNNGMKDQVLALKWIQENIASFGGDPDEVTLTGLSAGGSSVHLHYFSELSKNLFRRGFSQSGIALNPWSIQEKPLIKTEKLATALGCPTSDTKTMVQCLKERPFRQLLEQMDSFFAYEFLPFAPFAPVVERKGTKPFLKDDPYVLLKRGQVIDVPWIASMTTQEGLYPTLMILDDLDNLDSRWEELAPSVMEFNNTLHPPLWKTTAQKIKKEYFGDDKISKENMMKVMEMFGDRVFHANTDTAVLLQAKANKSPVYLYFFGYPGDNELKFVCHGEDARYFYKTTFVPKPLTPNEHKMKDKLVKMLISYAETGVPVFDGIEWKPITNDDLTYLEVNGFESEEIKIKTTKEIGNSRFWNSLNLQEGENLLLVKEEL